MVAPRRRTRGAGRLAGLAPAGGVRILTSAKATVAALEGDDPATDLAAYRREGFVRAALRRFGDGQTTSGQSLVIRLGSTAQARKETARNIALIRRDAAAATGGTTGGTTGRLWSLRRIPGSLGFVEHFKNGGAILEFAGVVFSDGPYYYLVTAGSPNARIEGRDVFDAAAALYTRVHPQTPPGV